MRSPLGVSAFLICVIAIGDLVAAAPPARKTTRSIDCRRLVFHPQCRGVAAKRASVPAMPNALLEGLDTQYERDLDVPPAPLVAPAQALPALGVEFLSSDRLLAALLSRIASAKQPGNHGNADNLNDILTSESGPNSGDLGKPEYGRLEWQPHRKRGELTQPEVSFDY